MEVAGPCKLGETVIRGPPLGANGEMVEPCNDVVLNDPIAAESPPETTAGLAKLCNDVVAACELADSLEMEDVVADVAWGPMLP